MTKGSLSRRGTLLAAAGLAGVALASPALAQRGGNYPNRPITLVVPFPPGGTSDSLARLFARKLSEQMGQTWVVDNRPGASGLLAADIVSRAAPDGYTLMHMTGGILTQRPHLMPVNFDPFKGFTPLVMTAVAHDLFACHPSLPVKSVGEMVDYAKQRPGQLFFGSAGNATITQIYGEMLKDRTGIQIQHVPYRGSVAALTDTMSNRVQMIFDVIAVQSALDKRVTPLANLGIGRNPQLPDTPTMEEAGFGDAAGQGLSWFSIMGPGNLPAEINAQLTREILLAYRQEDTQKSIATLGCAPTLMTGDAFGQIIRDQSDMFAALFKRIDMKID